MTPQKAGIGRITAAVVAMAAMLPYLTLKIFWLTGHPVGVSDPAFMDDPAMVGLNVMTFGMDAVALLLALAFTTRQGMRLPAWLVLLPLWVGTGLLSVVIVTVPVSVLVSGPSIFVTDGPIAPWVYMMVYGGFIGQGVGLIVAFVLYIRDRWPVVFSTALGYGYASPTRPFQTVVARGALPVSALLGGIRLFWAAGNPSPEQALQDGFKGLLALGAGIALVLLVRGRGSGAFWPPLVVGWLGTGVMFGWGLYAMILTVTAGPLGAKMTGAVGLVELFGTLTGLVMAMCGAFLLAERSGMGAGRSGVGHVQPAQDALEGEDREGDRQTADHGHR
ncbi:hypothetical protein AB0H88_48280 [Nonomuraea sp. NPDC050680]|uniref:hypothetical protein n=1 Tax=Nonomuraea sp. NPDC050680 TaxID=3154630 RepID=UPI0033C339A5